MDKILESAAVNELGERVRLTSVNTDSLELEYVWMIEFLHELYFFPHVESIGLLFVHFQHHYVASSQVANFKHLTEEAGPELLALEVIQPVEVSEGPLESLAGGVRPLNEAILGPADSLEYERFHDICNRINILL